MKLVRVSSMKNGVPTFIYFNQETGEQVFELYQDSDYELVEACLEACGISTTTN